MATNILENFQGVVCCCLGDSRTVEETIYQLLDLKTLSNCDGLNNVAELKLKNKYYQATIQLFDLDNIENDDKELKEQLLTETHAIILYGNGQKLTVDQLDNRVKKFASVGGEPRILLYDGIDEECPSHKVFLDWSIQNGFDMIDAKGETARDQVIDSLSAYRWTYRSDETDSKNKPKLDNELMKKLVDFDSLLGKLSAYRDRPELRGNPNDENIMEIADLLSGLLGDDVDNFLDEGESSNKEK